jgi:hypothetical protein
MQLAGERPFAVQAAEVDPVRFYEHWVNGDALRSIAMLIDYPPPSVAPQALERSEAVEETAIIELPELASDVALPALRPECLRPIRNVILHGSQATGDTCAFSDIDIMVVVEDRKTFSLAEHRLAVQELKRLLRAAYRHDPLMHHGLMFFPGSRLDAYDQTFLPIETLRCARGLHGERITLRETAVSLAAVSAALRGAALSLRKHFSTGQFLTNDYDLKKVIAGILLMPARVLATMETFPYKRDSFELARPHFTPRQWDFIWRAEAIRATWIKPPTPSRFIPDHAHPQAIVRATRSFPPRINARRIGHATADGLNRSAAAFLNCIDAMT